jgi:O-antigen/teichoic acid export membrane protein
VNVPRYLLEATSERSVLGVLGALFQLVVIGHMIVASLAQSVVPRLARMAATAEWNAFTRLVGRLMIFGFLLGALAVLLVTTIGRPVLRYVYTSEFAEHVDILLWLTLAATVSWTFVFLGSAINAMRQFRVQTWIHGFAAATILVASLLLVPPHGLQGACWALLCGALGEAGALSLAFYYVLRDRLGARVDASIS